MAFPTSSFGPRVPVKLAPTVTKTPVRTVEKTPVRTLFVGPPEPTFVGPPEPSIAATKPEPPPYVESNVQKTTSEDTMTYKRRITPEPELSVQDDGIHRMSYIDPNISRMSKSQDPADYDDGTGHDLGDPVDDGSGFVDDEWNTGEDTPPEDDAPPGLSTGAKVLIGVAALGGLFLIVRAMR